MFYQFTQLLPMNFIMLLYIRSRRCVKKANHLLSRGWRFCKTPTEKQSREERN